MKKYKSLIFILISALFVSIFVGCKTKIDMTPSSFLSEKNLADNAVFYTGQSVKKPSFKLYNNKTDHLYIKFDTETTFNTVALFGDGKDIEKIQLYILKDNVETLIYQQDYITDFRYMTFPTVSSAMLKISVFSSKTYSFDKIEIYNVTKKSDSFRQTAYITTASINNANDLDEGHFSHLTDIILFGSANFDNNGNIDLDVEVFETALNKVLAMQQRLNKDYNIYINILSYHPEYVSTDWVEKQKELGAYVREAFDKNREKLINNILNILDKYGLDGVAFDYEYPYLKKDYRSYSNFLVELKSNLGNKKLAVALADWGLGLSAKAKKAIDVLELMSYDLADHRGNHSDFYLNTVKAIQKVLNAGFKKEQIDIGLPFYARPTDMGELWTGYNEEYQKLGRYNNFVEEPYFDGNGKEFAPRYYNGYQMIFDKIRYSSDFGIGGAMVWHYACDIASDNPLSLFNAMDEALKYR